MELIKYQFEGKMNDILIEDINSSNNNILKFIKDPQEYIKKNLENYYKKKTIDFFTSHDFNDLENNLTNFINDLPNEIQIMERKVIDIENEN